jgi:two-component system response regulator GlrR
MAVRLLIIEASSDASESSCQNVLNADLSCERQPWESFQPDTLARCTAQLIVPHAGRETPKAILLFSWLREHPIRTPVLAILPESPNRELWCAASEAADDFVLWPLREGELNQRIVRILERHSGEQRRIQSKTDHERVFARLVGKHPAFLQAVDQIPLFAATDAPVLIEGETGTGKEMFAHAIHSLSARRNGPFVPLDCAALPDQLAENELFGHRRGAFTDAYADQKGLAAMADGGTLFLDEVDSLSPANQAKLLRFLQEGTYRSLGSDRFSSSNVRIIAATNSRMEEQVRQRQFRSDLYFRLDVLRLRLSPLRERRGDVSLLAKYFLEEQGAAGKPGAKFFSEAALHALESHNWPGNVRELFNAVQRASVCCLGPKITPGHIMLLTELTGAGDAALPADNFRAAKSQSIEQFERAYVEELMNRHHGNVTQAAREARKERRSFGRLVKKYRSTTSWLPS